MRGRAGTWLKYAKALAIVLVVLVLWRLGRRVDWGEVRHSFGQANAFLLVAAMIGSGVTNLLRAFRWRALLSPFGQVHIHDSFAATNIGIGGGFLLGAAVGELIRPLTLSLLNRQVPATGSFLTIMVERLFDLTVVSILFGLTLLWLPVSDVHPAADFRTRTLGVLLLLLPPFGVGAMFLFRRRSVGMREWLTTRITRKADTDVIRRTASRFLGRLMSVLDLLSNKREFTVVSVWTIAQWSANILANWVTLRAFGLHLGLKETVLLICCGLLGSLVPTPGGAAGAFHLAFSTGLVFLGVSLERAAAISIAAHLVGFVPALVVGLYYLLRGSINLAQLRLKVSEAAQQDGEHWGGMNVEK